MSQTDTIGQRINRVMEKVEYIKKDKKVETYMAVTHDAVTAEVRKWFVEFGIFPTALLQEQAMVDTGETTTKGTKIWRYEAVYEVRFHNTDDFEQYVSLIVSAHGNDYGDKAPGKVLSYAVKSAILKLLMIETGINDEGRVTKSGKPEEGETEEAGMPTAQREAIIAGIKAAGTKEVLSLATKDAFEKARVARDGDAHEAFRDAAMVRAAELQPVTTS